jgi:VWFA-related protein
MPRYRRLAYVFASAGAVASGILASGILANATLHSTAQSDTNYVRVEVFPTANGVAVTDLRRDEFELFEDKVPQQIDQFDHIVNRGGGVFVLVLDTYHVEAELWRNIKKPLADALDRVIGPDDLVGALTPEMSGSDIAFARKTTIEGLLSRYWPEDKGDQRGQPNQSNGGESEEDHYRICYPGLGPTPQCLEDDRGVADEMIERRHENRTIDSLHHLVRFVRDVREERKAIVVITSGWRLFKPHAQLARRLSCQTPIKTQPAGFRAAMMFACDSDRSSLAQLDDDRELRQLVDEANFANASFYPIDPRSVSAVEVGTGVGTGTSRPHANSLRSLADATDGFAVVGANDLDAGLKRLASDLAPYYLIGYSPTNAKRDGTFRSVAVRVKRPGVVVRARRGYLAPAAVNTSPSRTSAPATPGISRAETTVASSAEKAVEQLGTVTGDAPFRVLVTAGWSSDASGVPAPVFWTVAEIADRIPGAEIQADLNTATGASLASARGEIAPGSTSALLLLRPEERLASGDYVVRVTSQAAEGPTVSSVSVSLPPPPQPSGAVFIRRGPVTGNRDVPTADRRFRRSEQLRVEVPMLEDRGLAAPRPAGAVTARLLDRTGKRLPVPVTAEAREDMDGTRWLTAQLALVPLAPGDYIIELATAPGPGRSGAAGTEQPRTLVAFRMIH